MFCSQCGTNNTTNAAYCPNCGAQLQQAGGSSLSANLPDGPKHAGFWLRVLAYVIDYILSYLASLIIVIPFAFILGMSMVGSATSEEIKSAGAVLGLVMGIITIWLWFTLAESSSWQASPGKKLLGLKVTDTQGQRIGFGRANARFWSKILSSLTLCIGYLMVAFTKNKQGLHDHIADTFVVRKS